ncbi:terminal uridylyltransferase 4 [Rhineura floridana]|uniref:terminal uridylyltransferase 4 n=1 Tax=Rhineura floridana TaxID=261503 RepID=UPI002AC80E2B|nr:terminal uridylyltransferase 4 [Rhineura floridana]XP_061488978.1 terminal uridylyltransferase 4 [Rhineura floridana]
MEEGRSSKTGNHDTRKSAHVVCEESKAVRVATNQNYKTNKSDKSIKETGKSSSSGSSCKKNKQNDVCPEKSGENKSCKTNSCVAGCKDVGSNLQDQSNSKAKRLPNLPAAVENLKQLRVQHMDVNLSGSHILENGASTKTLPTAQRGNSELENPPGDDTSKIYINWPSDSVKQGLDLGPMEHKPEGSCKIKNSDPAKETISEVDYLENTAVIDESTLIAEQQLGLKQAEERLERDYIIRLEKRSPEYSNCQYLCTLCLVHIENIQGAHKHIKEKRHKKNIMEKQEENELRALPPPPPAQVTALSFTLMEAAKEQGISDNDFKIRQEIVCDMEKIIQQPLPECSLRMYGSCLSRFAFKTSDINIDIKYPSTMNHPDVLIQVLDILKNSTSYSDVESDFHAKVPVVFCKDVKSGLTCKVSAGNDVACLTTDLLAALGKLEPVLVPLVLAFRYWARLCHIDCQAEGGIPSYSFALMVIFFLQQREPRILPSYLGNRIEGFDSKKADDYHLKGIEDENFVVWEYKPSNNGAGKNLSGVEGKAKGEQHRGGNKNAATLETDTQNNPKDKNGKSPLALETPHQISLGQLWLELLKFYTLEFALEEYVISIRVQELLTRENKTWPKRRIAIEDPFALKRNVARSLNSQMVFEYILERFRTAYKYFACPQTKDGSKSKLDIKKKEKGKIGSKKTGEPVANCCLPQQANITEKQNAGHASNVQESEFNECGEMEPTSRRCTGDLESLLVKKTETENTSSQDEKETISLITNKCCELEQKSPKAKNDQEPSNEKEQSHHCIFSDCRSLDADSVSELSDTESQLSSVMEHPQKSRCSGTSTAATSHNCKAVAEIQDTKDDITTEDMHYVFDKFILTSGKPPTIVCSICKRDGHSKNDCPEDFKKIDLKPLPPMTSRFREILDLVCKRCFDELSPPFSEQQNREQILASLERFIRKEYNDKARLCLFGSSKNGFGFRDSDLDICMTLEGHENAEKLNCKEIIESLAKVLKKHPGLRNILPITTAKVPIVKFEHRRSGLEGDISLYNTLAQHNTRMLATYAAIDSRVQYLGYTMKVFAKRCDIGDASRGSLSSYAYILMVLYFLQQRTPPVIPVLQEIFDGQQIPQRMVDGWNAFFFDDTEELKKRLPSLEKNTESLGELWLGLLRFYTEEFDFKEYVISIRQKTLLTTFEKQWTSKCIAIEDPFDLNHNLGAGVSRKMTNFIMKALINGRKLFGTPFYPVLGREAEYFFNSKVLTDGELAPNDRCCRVCGKIGHYMKDCPKRRRLKKKENDRDDENEIKEEDRETREKRCFICGDVGHVRRDCPEFKQTRQRSNGVPATQLVRSLVNSQQVTGSIQQQVERPLRTRQPSECSDSRQPSYSPQPQQFTQNSSPPSSINQAQPQPISQSKHALQPQQGAQPPHQVQLPLFNFPQSPPGQYATLPNLGLFQVHHHHQIQLPNASWPVIHSAPGNPSHTTNVPFSVRAGGSSSPPNNQSSVSLNDPSIIFAQPAARPVGIPSSSHEGHWRNPVTLSSLVNNGTVGNSDQGFPGQFGKVNPPPPPPVPWDHGAPAHFPLLRGAWPYSMSPNYMQQGNASYPLNKPFYPQAGLLMQNNQRFSLLSQGHPHLNMNFIQQKK